MLNNEYLTNVIQKYSDMVYRLALTRCCNNENAEDIFQEVFLKLSEKHPKFNDENHEKAWIIRVTINMTKNFNKSSWNRNVVELDENIVGNNDTSAINNVFDEVMKLQHEYRTVIYLFYYEGYKVKEISKAIQVEHYLSKDQILELYLNLIVLN